MDLIKKLLYIFNRKQKFHLFILGIMIVIGALLELVGITAILPFITVAMDTGKIYENEVLNELYCFFRISSPNIFLALMAIGLIVIYILKNAYLIWMNNKIFKFNYENQRKLTNRLISCYMKEPYTFFLKYNSTELLRNVKDDTAMMFDAVLVTMQLAVECLVCGLLLIFLMITDPSITIAVGTVMIGFLLVIMRIIKKSILKRGEKTRIALASMTKWMMQMFGGIKEIKIIGGEEFFKEHINKENQVWVENKRKYQILSYIPKPLMETICVSSVLLVVALKLLTGVSSTYFITTVSVFAVAAFRLLPAFNRITGHVSRIFFNLPSIRSVYDDLVRVEQLEKKEKKQIENQLENIEFKNQIELKNISFRYPESKDLILNQACLTIPKNTSVAFIGASGAGKTTLADIILGILYPQSGEILLDGVDISSNMSLWQQKLGYIPQTIYMLDDTIKNNIAFGIDEEEIDDVKLKQAIDDAQLTDFIKKLPDGVETFIGEAGVRLSGGQRQRIGIARALYRNPDVLVLDEATSALDNETEAAVMEAIEKFGGKKTLLIIAHRLSTIKNCNIVYEIKDKKAIMTKNTNRD